MSVSSREALRHVESTLADSVAASPDPIATGILVGNELSGVLRVIEGDRSLLAALSDSTAAPAARGALATAVFSQALSPTTLGILVEAVSADWSRSKDLRKGLVTLSREAWLLSAQAQGQLALVEEELFRLGRILAANPALEQDLSDPIVDVEGRKALLAQVLYGKVTAITEILASDAIARPSQHPADDLDALSHMAAHMRGQEVATVRSAIELTGSQREKLRQDLERSYDRAFSLHTEVDCDLDGGMVIRIGDLLIDGSLSSRLAEVRRGLS